MAIYMYNKLIISNGSLVSIVLYNQIHYEQLCYNLVAVYSKYNKSIKEFNCMPSNNLHGCSVVVPKFKAMKSVRNEGSGLVSCEASFNPCVHFFKLKP